MPAVIDAFTQAIAAAGLAPPNTVIADGALHRFSSSGRRNDNSGWYCLFDDIMPVGVFGCWRSGMTQAWYSKAESAQTPAESVALRQRMQAAKALRDQEKAARQQRVAVSAQATWGAATPAKADHPYLAAKQVGPHNLRSNMSLLLVPVFEPSGSLTSLQTIAANGQKRFLTGGRLQGCYCLLGQPGPVIVIGEGWATCASIQEATGLPVAAAFFAGNLQPVAQALRRQYPDAVLVLAADDDHDTEGNPGVSAARAAALSIGALVVFPQFPADRPRKATDFNDLHSLVGAGAVRACFAEVLEGIAHDATH